MAKNKKLRSPKWLRIVFWVSGALYTVFLVAVRVIDSSYPFGTWLLQAAAFTLVVAIAYTILIVALISIVDNRFRLFYSKVLAERHEDVLQFVYVSRLGFKRRKKLLRLAPGQTFFIEESHRFYDKYLQVWDGDPWMHYDAYIMVPTRSDRTKLFEMNAAVIHQRPELRESLTAALVQWWGSTEFAPELDLHTWQSTVIKPPPPTSPYVTKP
jgi:hypothetical protein